MDIIYTDATFADEGVLTGCIADFETSEKATDNTFEIETSLSNHKVALGGYVYIDGTEYGGRVDAVNIDTGRATVRYKGRTWLGILSSKIVSPDSGSNYLTVSGDANTLLGTLIARCGLDNIFAANPESADITVNYQVPRYVDLFTAIFGMLKEYGAKLSVSYGNGSVILGAVPIAEYTDGEELSNDAFDFEIETNSAAANHVIALGSGTLSSRTVVHRYVQSDGTIGSTQYYEDADEVAIVLDMPNAESTDELTAKADEALAKAAIEDSLKITANNITADVGDLFAAHDHVSGLTVEQYVTDKITVIDGDSVKISYKMGGAK